MFDTVFEACREPELWIFIEVYYVNIFEPLEGARHWGLVCKCHVELRAENPGRRCKCVYNSRRLPEARTFVQELWQSFRDKGRRADFAGACGVHWIAPSLSLCQRSIAQDGKFKTNRISECSSPEQAAVCAAELRDGDVTFFSSILLHYRSESLEDLLEMPFL